MHEGARTTTNDVPLFVGGDRFTDDTVPIVAVAERIPHSPTCSRERARAPK